MENGLGPKEAVLRTVRYRNAEVKRSKMHTRYNVVGYRKLRSRLTDSPRVTAPGA